MEQKLSLVQLNKLNKIQRIILYFFIYAFLGWILETVYCLATLGVFQKRGFLYGPICPIYGIGAILLILALKNRKAKFITKFLICMILFTGFEYFVSYFLEALFGLRWWDYSNEFLNINGRVSLVFSIAWGIIGVLFVDKAHIAIEKQIQRRTLFMKKEIQVTIISLFCLLLILDTIFSVVKYIA